MEVLVSGGTGFIGRELVNKLLEQGFMITLIVRDVIKAKLLFPHKEIKFIECDLYANPEIIYSNTTLPTSFIHLAWEGLPNYESPHHLTTNLPADLRLLNNLINDNKVKHLVVTGTCLEFGDRYGPLSEDSETNPMIPYGIAKDALRKNLLALNKPSRFTFQWVRLFYAYGKTQNPKSLYPQIMNAIEKGDQSVRISKGSQIRDFIPVEHIVDCLIGALKTPNVTGVINCCSGEPKSVLEFTEEIISLSNASINIERGHYPIPEYEPLAFWGVKEKMNLLKKLTP